MPRFTGQSEVDFERGALEARVDALGKASDEAKGDIRQMRSEIREIHDSQMRMETSLKAAMRITGAVGTVVGALITLLGFLGFSFHKS